MYTYSQQNNKVKNKPPNSQKKHSYLTVDVDNSSKNKIQYLPTIYDYLPIYD